MTFLVSLAFMQVMVVFLFVAALSAAALVGAALVAPSRSVINARASGEVAFDDFQFADT